jgi:hypothetical protein
MEIRLGVRFLIGSRLVSLLLLFVRRRTAPVTETIFID